MGDINKLANIKKYGNAYKLTLLKHLPHGIGGGTVSKEKSDHKLNSNISRAKARIFELGMCNSWEYFITCTLDQQKYDRSNLKKFQTDIALFIRHQRAKHKSEIKYLFIPEKHKDGNWHIHGFITGLPRDALTEFTIKDKIPVDLKRRICEGETIYNWWDYAAYTGAAEPQFR